MWGLFIDSAVTSIFSYEILDPVDCHKQASQMNSVSKKQPEYPVKKLSFFLDRSYRLFF